MQCSCGGVMQDHRSVRTPKGAVLEYQRCVACGRQDGYWLFCVGEPMARGQLARTWYASLDQTASSD